MESEVLMNLADDLLVSLLFLCKSDYDDLWKEVDVTSMKLTETI